MAAGESYTWNRDRFHGNGVATATITTTRTLVGGSMRSQRLTASGGNVNCDLPANANSAGLYFYIANVGASNNIVVRDAAAATISTVAPGNWVMVAFSLSDAAWVQAAGGINTAAATLAVTLADGLTVGGLIVPQHLEISCRISKIAGDVIYTCFSAARAYAVTNVRYVPRILQGGAMTVTAVKATVNATPAAATTPLTTASFDGNANADTTQVGTLTATGADLLLAAGDKLGVVLSTASTVGQSDVFISLKRV